MGTMGKQTSSAGERFSARDGMSEGNFDCNICLELAQEPVVTLCGHLFCWPCLYRWLNSHSLSQDCPVCKVMLKEDTLVPLYGAGNPKPMSKSKPMIPNRPLAPRPIPTSLSPHHQTLNNNQQQGFNFTSTHPYSQPLGGGHMGTRSVTFTSGFGLFPPPFAPPPYSSAMLGSGGIPRSLDPIQQRQDDLLYRLFLFLSCFTVVCLLFF